MSALHARKTPVRLAVGAAAALLFLLPAAPAAADTSVVSFDDQSAGTDITSQYNSSAHVYFRGNAFGDGNLPHVDATAQSHSTPNVVDVACTGGGTTCGEFPPSATVGRLSIYANTVTVTVGYLGPSSDTAQVTLTALDQHDMQIAQSGPVTVAQGAPFSQTLTVSTGGADTIASFKLAGASQDYGKRVGFDDLTIQRSGTAAPDFGIKPNPQPADVSQGNSVEVPISVNRANGSNGNISFDVSGLPTGMTGSFSPNPVTGTGEATTLTLTAADNAPASDPYSDLQITATPTPGAGAAPRTATVSTRVRQNCDRIVRIDYVDARTDGCMKALGPDKEEIFNQNVHLNGLLIAPLSGDRDLIIDKKNRTIKGNKSTDVFGVSVDGQPEIQLYAGPINWDLSGSGSSPKKVLDFNVPGASRLKGFPLTHIAASLTQAGKSQITPTLKLDFWPFNYLGAITASTQFTTDNDHGADFTGLDLTIPDVKVVALELKDINLHWQEGQSWSGGATLALNFGHKFEVGAGFGLKDGSFDFLRANVGGLNLDVGLGLFLQSIGVEVHRDPLALAGSVGLTAGPEVAGKSAISVDGTLKAVLADPFIVEVNGNAKLAGQFNLGNAFVRYTSTGLFEFGGMVDFSWSILHMTGGVQGWVDGLSAFNLEGSLQGCIDIFGPDICGDAKAVVSSKGLGGCVGAFGHHVGVGATWDLNFDAFTGCDLTPFSEKHPKVRAAANVGSFTLPAGLPSVAFELTGTGAPPGVTLTGPHGEIVTVSRSVPSVLNAQFLAQMRGNNTTFVLVDKPAPGVWRLNDDGAVPVTRVREARGLPQASVRATVGGRGRSRVLKWKLRPISGQRVTFAEIGKDVRNVITKTSAGSGTVKFRPADGPAGVRRIVALVEQNGRPRVDLEAGSYRAPGPLRPGRPTRARIVRRGSSLVVSWQPHPAGFLHVVYLSRTDGQRLVLLAPMRRKSVIVRGVPKTVGASARIFGVTTLNARGPAAQASIKRKG